MFSKYDRHTFIAGSEKALVPWYENEQVFDEEPIVPNPVSEFRFKSVPMQGPSGEGVRFFRHMRSDLFLLG